MRKFVLCILMALAFNVNAAPTTDEFQLETYAATRAAYNMLLNSLEIIETCVGCDPIIVTHQEPAICWEFPLEFNEFYRRIQDNVNITVSEYPRREQNRIGPLVGWFVWNALQDEYGCF